MNTIKHPFGMPLFFALTLFFLTSRAPLYVTHSDAFYAQQRHSFDDMPKGLDMHWQRPFTMNYPQPLPLQRHNLALLPQTPSMAWSLPSPRTVHGLLIPLGHGSTP
jgi:hypothetical protein